MEEKRQKLPSLFSKFAGSVMEKADKDLHIRCFTKKQIKSITHNYNNVLGKGGFSVVYEGRLDDGRPVAVKKYYFPSKKKEFTKVIIQSQFSHRNIVRLLGCCVEADAPILVTEFVPNGNLSDLLHNLNAHRVPLSLYTRLKIASDVAEALVYMHTSQSHPILHGDIKPENIFLDNKHMPKVSDFGISRLLSMNSDEYTGYVIGTMGYVDPEYCQTGRLTTKSDVYSFGVVLLELVSRKKAIDDNKNVLAKTFARVNTKFNRHEILDREIATAENMEVLDGIVNLALECVKFEQEERPDMRDVCECLRNLQRTNGRKHLQEMVSSLQQSGFERFLSKQGINEMTDNFKSIITECFMGKIYRGKLGKMPSVAIIKMSSEVHSGLSKEFSRQIILHTKVDHENVVDFVGCCLDGDVPILVYEFAKASLHDIIFGDVSNNRTINSEARLHIAISIAEGLDYLHSLGIVHGDFRTANVIVVNDISQEKKLYYVQVKISGIAASVYLSMAKAIHERIKVEDNNGYMGPRLLETGVLTKEADVYSLGVVLLELFTGTMVSNRIRKCRLLEELWDKPVCSHIEGTRMLIFRFLNPDVRRRPTLAEAIRWFKEEQDGLFIDRLDGHFCSDNCAARASK